jgi:hypothetical protein
VKQFIEEKIKATSSIQELELNLNSNPFSEIVNLSQEIQDHKSILVRIHHTSKNLYQENESGRSYHTYGSNYQNSQANFFKNSQGRNIFTTPGAQPGSMGNFGSNMNFLGSNATGAPGNMQKFAQNQNFLSGKSRQFYISTIKVLIEKNVAFGIQDLDALLAAKLLEKDIKER